ncbi:MAG: hypothetical protein QW650_00245 [Thermofilum sp.]
MRTRRIVKVEGKLVARKIFVQEGPILVAWVFEPSEGEKEGLWIACEKEDRVEVTFEVVGKAGRAIHFPEEVEVEGKRLLAVGGLDPHDTYLVLCRESWDDPVEERSWARVLAWKVRGEVQEAYEGAIVTYCVLEASFAAEWDRDEEGEGVILELPEDVAWGHKSFAALCRIA